MESERILAVRIDAREKQALRYLALENGYPSMSAYVIAILRQNTPVSERAKNFSTIVRRSEQNVPIDNTPNQSKNEDKPNNA